MGTGGFLARKAGGQWPLTMRYELWVVIVHPLGISTGSAW